MDKICVMAMVSKLHDRLTSIGRVTGSIRGCITEVTGGDSKPAPNGVTLRSMLDMCNDMADIIHADLIEAQGELMGYATGEVACHSDTAPISNMSPMPKKSMYRGG